MKKNRKDCTFQTEASAKFYCCENNCERTSTKENKANPSFINLNDVKSAADGNGTKTPDRKYGKVGKEVLFINSCYYVFILV